MALFDSKDKFERNLSQFKNWTKEQDDTLKTMVKAKYNLADIAKELDKTKFAIIMRIRYISGMENVNTKGSMPFNLFDQTATWQQVYTERMQKWSSLDNERLKTMFSQGENIYNLSNLFHRSPTAIVLHLQELYNTPSLLNKVFVYCSQFVGRTRIVTQKTTPVAEETPTEEIVEQQPELNNEPTVESIDWDKYNAEQRALYPNHGKTWTKEDEELLKLLFTQKDCNLEVLSMVFKRNVHAIQMKLERMGIIKS